MKTYIERCKDMKDQLNNLINAVNHIAYLWEEDEDIKNAFTDEDYIDIGKFHDIENELTFWAYRKIDTMNKEIVESSFLCAIRESEKTLKENNVKDEGVRILLEKCLDNALKIYNEQKKDGSW